MFFINNQSYNIKYPNNTDCINEDQQNLIFFKVFFSFNIQEMIIVNFKKKHTHNFYFILIFFFKN